MTGDEIDSNQFFLTDHLIGYALNPGGKPNKYAGNCFLSSHIRSVYIPSFPFSFSNLRTKNEFLFRFQICERKTNSFFVFKFANEKQKTNSCFVKSKVRKTKNEFVFTFRMLQSHRHFRCPIKVGSFGGIFGRSGRNSYLNLVCKLFDLGLL